MLDFPTSRRSLRAILLRHGVVSRVQPTGSSRAWVTRVRTRPSHPPSSSSSSSSLAAHVGC
eukprot:743746-Rhodomonas_salina.1